MSSETQANADTAGQAECTSCGTALGERRLALQSYPETEEAALSGLSTGGLLYCRDCAAEPVELVDSWEDHDRPPIDADRSIGAGYRTAAERCSFCSDDLAAPVVGVELYRRPGDRLPAYANYTLCSDCQTVFEEFLANVRERQ